MSDSDVYNPSTSFTENCDTLYSSSREEMEVASTIQPYEKVPRFQTKISTKTENTVFRLRCLGQD